MSCKVIPSYASDYPKEFLLIKGIEKCFKYYINIIQFSTMIQGYKFLDARVEKINKYLDLYDKKVRVPTEIIYDDLKNYLVLRALLEDIKDRFDFYVIRGRNNSPYEIVDPYIPCAF